MKHQTTQNLEYFTRQVRALLKHKGEPTPKGVWRPFRGDARGRYKLYLEDETRIEFNYAGPKRGYSVHIRDDVGQLTVFQTTDPRVVLDRLDKSRS